MKSVNFVFAVAPGPFTTLSELIRLIAEFHQEDFVMVFQKK
jgi:hypothetical protein